MNSCRACISAGRAPFYIWQILNTSVVRLIIRNYVDTWLRRKNYANPLMFRIGAANSFCEPLPEFFQLTLLKPIKDENLLSYVWNGYIIFKNTHFRHHFFIDKPYWRGLRNDRSYIYIYYIHPSKYIGIVTPGFSYRSSTGRFDSNVLALFITFKLVCSILVVHLEGPEI